MSFGFIQSLTEQSESHPLVSEVSHPLVSEASHPLVSEVSHPLVSEASHPLVSEALHPLVSEASHPLVSEASHPLVSEVSHPLVSEASHPLVSEASHPLVSEASHPLVSEASHPFIPKQSSEEMSSFEQSVGSEEQLLLEQKDVEKISTTETEATSLSETFKVEYEELDNAILSPSTIRDRALSLSTVSSSSLASELTLITALETTPKTKNLEDAVNNVLSLAVNELVDIPINLETETMNNTSPSKPIIANELSSSPIHKTNWNFSSASKVHSAYVTLEAATVAKTENVILKALYKTLRVIQNVQKRTAFGHIIGAIKALILIVNNNYYNEKILKNCLKIIFQLAKNEITRKALGDYGMAEVLILALNQHTSDCAIARHGLRCISNLTYENHMNRKKLVCAGACETVMSLMSNNITSKKVAFRGVWAISNLCFVENDNKKTVGRRGCDLVVNAMSLHQVKRDITIYIMPTFMCPISEKVALWGCKAIVDLAENNATNKCFLGEIGACNEIVNCLDAYANRTDVCKWSLAAAATLMTDSVLNTQKFGQLHLVQHILKQLKMCKYSSPLLAEIGLAALYHLSLELSNRREIIELGGIEIVESFPNRMNNRNDCLKSIFGTAI